MKTTGRRSMQLSAVVIAGLALWVGACSDDATNDGPDSAAAGAAGGRADASRTDATGTGGTAGATGGSSGGAGTGGSAIGGNRRDAASDVADAARDVAADTARDAATDAAPDARDAAIDQGRDAPDVLVRDGGFDAQRDAVSDCGVPGALTPPSVPPPLQPPAGAVLARRVHAVGTQIYTCTGAPDAGSDGGSSYAWILKAPAAVLFDDNCAAGGTHFAGPTWQSTDGSSVVGARVAGADVTGAIPWLLLRAASNTGEGVFSNVSAVQRVDTVGGLAPADGCNATSVTTERAIAYTATYYFYTGGTWPVAEAGADAAAPATDAPVDVASDASDGG